jgi:outer membrane immunogenic protein
MKKTFTLIAIMTFSMNLIMAQQTRFGFQAGMTLASIHQSGYGESHNMDRKPGFTAGLVVDKQLGKKFIFQPELNWTQKGGNESGDITSHVTLNYIEVPLKLLYRARGDHGFFIGGGPAIAFGVGGKLKASDYSMDLHFGDGADKIGKPFDASVMATAGFLTKRGLQFSVAYDQSFINYSNETGSSIRNNYFAFRVGYLFKKGKH